MTEGVDIDVGAFAKPAKYAAQQSHAQHQRGAQHGRGHDHGSRQGSHRADLLDGGQELAPLHDRSPPVRKSLTGVWGRVAQTGRQGRPDVQKGPARTVPGRYPEKIAGSSVAD